MSRDLSMEDERQIRLPNNWISGMLVKFCLRLATLHSKGGKSEVFESGKAFWHFMLYHQGIVDLQSDHCTSLRGKMKKSTPQHIDYKTKALKLLALPVGTPMDKRCNIFLKKHRQ